MITKCRVIKLAYPYISVWNGDDLFTIFHSIHWHLVQGVAILISVTQHQ